MKSKLIFVILFTFLSKSIFGNADLLKFLPEFQKEWIKYLNNSNRSDSGSSKCEQHLYLMVESLNDFEDDWALRMLDSSTKLQSGYMEGNLIDFGHFDQCLQVRHDSKEFGQIKGQHCVFFTDFDMTQMLSSVKKIMDPIKDISGLNSILDLDPIMKETLDIKEQEETMQNETKDFYDPIRAKRDNPILGWPLGFSVCLPASCSPIEVRDTVNSFLGIINQSVKPDFKPESYCNTDELITLTVADKTCLVLFSLVALAMMLSTCYDVAMRYMEGRDKNRALLAFSVLSNGEKLFAMDTADASKGDILHCIHGIRALTIMWIVLCHRYALSLYMPLKNSAILMSWHMKPFAPLIFSGSVAVDTFFVISGSLLSYVFLKNVTKSYRFNIRMFYIHRYLRITSVLAPFIFFHATLAAYLGSGPSWKPFIKEVMVENCVKNWWSNFLFVQNYFRPTESCLEQTWYLDCDMQLFLLSPLILIPMWKRAKIAVHISMMLLLVSMIIIFFVAYINEFPGLLNPLGNNDNIVKLLYKPTHTRFGPWLLGLLLGYLLHLYRNTKAKLNWILVGITWIVSLLSLLAVLYGSSFIMQLEKERQLLAGALYQASSRMVWSLSICWIIFACSKGYGGPVNWLLSLPIWKPISRLSFCIYLCHMPIQMGIQLSKKQTDFFSDTDTIHKFFGDFGISICVATFLSLAFEAPFNVIQNLLLHAEEKPEISRAQKKKKEKAT